MQRCAFFVSRMGEVLLIFIIRGPIGYQHG